MMPKAIPMLDLMFFLAETKRSPKHVAGLMLFDLPDDAREGYVAELAAAYRKGTPVPPFNYVPRFSLLGMPRWLEAEAVDMKYHVRHTALPAGATHHDLLDLVGELHTQLLDRQRPCFRAYFIEGLPNRQFALYLKIHHAMVDGASGVARLVGSLDERPVPGTMRPFYAVRLDGATVPGSHARGDALATLASLAMKQARALKELYASFVRKSQGAATVGPGSAPFTAPRTPMNEPMQAGRTLATLSLPIAEMRAVGKAFGGTLNDVAVTIVDAALQRYLAELGRAPTEPLLAMCPVSLREAGDQEATIKVSAVFVPLGKPKAPIGHRMQAVMRSIGSAKAELSGMGKDAAILYAVLAFVLGELADTAHADSIARPLANFVLSNVPGPRTDLYLGGARLREVYPISAMGAGMGLNVTLVSYSTAVNFGFVANGAAMPDLANLARHTAAAFDSLRRAAARRRASAQKAAAAAATPPGSPRSKTSRVQTSPRGRTSPRTRTSPRAR